ncbi:MAG TPA: CCA tRNA nucleotidyltransferase [Erysipelotrichaceae bacterium]|nr:CCA tRNA nucleotidyltransferase [Erysipelotrichaceae bacterium]
MDSKIIIFQNLADLFLSHGFNLYLVGGTVRDYLLNLPLTDMDAVSDATPDEILSFLEADDTFKHFGSLKHVTKEGIKFDITTLRKESSYLDGRHPSHIVFVKDLKSDYARRDFTINALYLDKNLEIYDFCNGLNDLKNRRLRMIGNPYLRIKEDPLRILRAIRFKLMYHLKIDEHLMKAMIENQFLLKNITDAKIRTELEKIDDSKVDQEEKNKIFEQFAIANLVGVIK